MHLTKQVKQNIFRMIDQQAIEFLQILK